jgi:hypothetical protein
MPVEVYSFKKTGNVKVNLSFQRLKKARTNSFYFYPDSAYADKIQENHSWQGNDQAGMREKMPQ